MKDNQIKALKATLGKDIFDVLEKTELYKLQTKTTVDPAEIQVALQIVPRTILSYLIMHLKPMINGGFLDLELPFVSGRMHINKYSNDVYSGELYSHEHKKIAEFKYRSLPSVGLVILTTFELYDLSEQSSVAIEIRPENGPVEENSLKLQALIDERLQLHNLIRNVVDNKISEREAMHRMLMLKIKESLVEQEEEPKEEAMGKKSKLKDFLEKRNKKEHEEIDKSEDLNCPDCDTVIYKSGENHIKCCVCYGNFRNKEIKFIKNANGVKFKFPKDFDVDNIDMILDALKNKNK
jgi:hypothetical protein